jgi:hypothetical protein
MTGGGDKVEESVDSIVSETRVSFDPGFLCEDIIVLSFQVSCDLGKTSLIINLITEPRCINDSQCNTSSLLFKI